MMDKFSTFTFGVHRQYINHRDNQKSSQHRDNQKSFHNDG